MPQPRMISYEEINWGTLAAAATLITLPVLVVALLDIVDRARDQCRGGCRVQAIWFH